MSETAASSSKRSFFVRSVYAGHDLEAFLVTAIATILIVRAALAATGWPQLGGGKIHVAHLLWGGLGMLIALILYMAMQGRLWRQLAMLAAGIGFGLFIDELGKFITSDNDYFFKPAIALIYVVFVALFLVTHAIAHGTAISPQAALVNAFDMAKEATIRDLNVTERNEALRLLARCNQSDPVVRDLKAMVARMDSEPKGLPRPYDRLKAWLTRVYDRLVEASWFKRVVVGWFIVLSLAALAYPFVTGTRLASLDLGQAGELASAVVAGVLVAVGLVRWRHSRLSAYRWFERAILVTIFIYEFFAFYEDQLKAVFGLVIVLITYATIRLLIAQERARETARLVGAASEAPGSEVDAPVAVAPDAPQ